MVLKYNRESKEWYSIIGNIPEDFLNWYNDFATTEYVDCTEAWRLFENCMNGAVVVMESDLSPDTMPFNMRCKDMAFGIIRSMRIDSPEKEIDNQEWVYAWTCIGAMVRSCYYYITALYKAELPINFSVKKYGNGIFNASVLCRK